MLRIKSRSKQWGNDWIKKTDYCDSVEEFKELAKNRDRLEILDVKPKEEIVYHNFEYEVTFTVTAKIKVKAEEGEEEEAREEALNEIADRTISELNIIEEEAELLNETEECCYCCHGYDTELFPLQWYNSERVCEDCLKDLKEDEEKED